MKKQSRKKKAVARKKAPCWYQDIPTLSFPDNTFDDDRGSLFVVKSAKTLQHPIGSVTVLRSKGGAERANHFHKTDSHLTFIADGAMEYFERQEDGTIFRTLVARGSSVFTPPKVEHCMRFVGDTIAVVLADRHRESADYEKDLVRVPSLAQEWDKLEAEKALLPTQAEPTG